MKKQKGFSAAELIIFMFIVLILLLVFAVPFFVINKDAHRSAPAGVVIQNSGNLTVSEENFDTVWYHTRVITIKDKNSGGETQCVTRNQAISCVKIK
jgi:uncharacterized membrane protein YwaF